MARIYLVALVALSLACSAEESQAPTEKAARTAPSQESADGGAPVIEAVEISPAEPTVADGLTVAVQVQDPDLDSIDVELEWFVNGASFNITEPNLEPYQFRKGDRVRVVVWASDGIHEVTEESETVVIENSPPRITSFELTPKNPMSTDMIEVKVSASDVDGDSYRYEYRWLLNNQLIPGETGSRLVSSKLKRSVKVTGQVRALDEDEASDWVTSHPVKVSNAPPKIASQPNYELSGPTQYSYQMQVADPDGDLPLKYELISGPPGMEISTTAGFVSWTIQPGTSGKFPVELAVSDPFGGLASQKYQLEVDWRDAEASDPAPVDPEDEAEFDAESDPANAAHDRDITRPSTDYEADEEMEDSEQEFEDQEGEAEEEF